MATDVSPLIGDGKNGTSIKTIIITVLSIGFFAATVGVIVLGVKLREAKQSPITPDNPGTPLPSNNPVRTADDSSEYN